MYQQILATVDGSPTSLAGVAEAAKLAKLTGGRVRLLHVIDELSTSLIDAPTDGGDSLEHLREGGATILRLASELVRASGVEVDTRLCEHDGQRLSDVVTAEAKHWPADLIVVGTHGRRGVARMILGSDAEKILRGSSVPVLLVRGSDAPVAATPD